MSKICGYSCEHNKSGVCQITGCSKKSYMSDKTETELFRETWYDINQIRQLQQENKQLKKQLLVTQTNEETFRLEMEDITQTLGLDEDTIFDDVKAYARSLKDNWIKLKEYAKEIISTDNELYGTDLLDKMQEIERGSDSNVKD